MFWVLLFFIIMALVFLGLYLKERMVHAKNRKVWFAACSYYDARLEKARNDYAALEQGRDEESDSYEQQFLTFREILGAQSEALEEQQKELDFHRENCLPHISTIRESLALSGL